MLNKYVESIHGVTEAQHKKTVMSYSMLRLSGASVCRYHNSAYSKQHQRVRDPAQHLLIAGSSPDPDEKKNRSNRTNH